TSAATSTTSSPATIQRTATNENRLGREKILKDAGGLMSTKSYSNATRNGCSSNGRAFHRDLDILTPSRPLNRSLDLPVCLARFLAARLWLKDESLEDSAIFPIPTSSPPK